MQPTQRVQGRAAVGAAVEAVPPLARLPQVALHTQQLLNVARVVQPQLHPEMMIVMMIIMMIMMTPT